MIHLAMAAVLATANVASDYRFDDYTVPIRPGSVEKKVPFWNRCAARFIWAPSFEFKKSWDAKYYRYRVYDANDRIHVFTNASPSATLAPVWNELPVGPAHVICEGMDKGGKMTAIAGMRWFWRSAPFKEGVYPPRTKTYAECAKRAYDYVLDCKSSQFFLKEGRPDPTYHINGYPSKMHASVIRGMVRMMKLEPARKDEALKLATLSGEFLLKTAEKPDAPLAYWPQTYWTNDNQKCSRPWLSGTIMSLYPAEVGEAYVELAEATGDRKWLEASERIAATYQKLRRADGTWPLVFECATGKVRAKNAAMPVRLARYFEMMEKATGKKAYGKIAEECLAWVEKNPLADWDWDGQFEDVGPSTAKYQNLTQHPALDMQMVLLARHADDPARVEVCRDLLRFCEDQFVFWEKPYFKDGRCVVFPDGGRIFGGANHRWEIPGVCEQYNCYTPVDASAAKLIQGYLAMYRVDGNPLHLKKARALGDKMTQLQLDDGFIPTFWGRCHGNDWMNCNIHSANTLFELAEFDGK